MESQIKAVAWMRIIWSCGILMLALLVLVVLGGIGVVAGSSSGMGAWPVAPWLAFIAVWISLIFGILALPGLITGWGLLNYRPWARILDIILSIFDLVHFPVGTVIGGYSLWVMLQPETAELFEGRVPPGRYPAHF